jgi:hypothetical protein
MRIQIQDYIARLRADATQQRTRYGNEIAARTLESVVGDLEEILHATQEELVNLTQASRLSGYSADHLGRLVREGKLRNYGRPNAPRVRPSDLPRKAGDLPEQQYSLHLGAAERLQTARSIVNSIK